MTMHAATGPTQAVEDLLFQLSARIKAVRAHTDHPVLIAIDGCSGAGKSTIAEHVALYLFAAMVSCDDFYAGGADVLPLDPKKLADICIDRSRLRKTLETLKANRHVLYAPFDWQAFDGSPAASQVLTAPRPFIIAEGVYSAHPDLRDIVDIAVLVRTPPAERERRLTEREGVIGRWERQWLRAEDWYFRSLAPPKCFDIVIDNT